MEDNWEETIRDMTNKGLLHLGPIKDGDLLVKEVIRRNKLNLLWRIFCMPIVEADGLYWAIFFKENRN